MSSDLFTVLDQVGRIASAILVLHVVLVLKSSHVSFYARNRHFTLSTSIVHSSILCYCSDLLSIGRTGLNPKAFAKKGLLLLILPPGEKKSRVSAQFAFFIDYPFFAAFGVSQDSPFLCFLVIGARLSDSCCFWLMQCASLGFACFRCECVLAHERRRHGAGPS